LVLLWDARAVGHQKEVEGTATAEPNEPKELYEWWSRRRLDVNLESTIKIHAGGVGSGCNPAAGKCGRNFVSYYHGTDKASAQRIKKQGILPGNVERGSQNKVYLAATPHEALEYGGRNGSVIRVEVPSSASSKVRWHDGDEDGTNGAYRHNGPIPAKYIKEVVPSNRKNADALDKKYRGTQKDSDLDDDDDF
jgi:RNA:NAD 2'-phosphotransferase (TPT1/KptA family)